MEQIIQLNSNANLSEHLASPSEATLGHSNKLDGSHLSPHFELGEMTKSNSHPEVYNIPAMRLSLTLSEYAGGWRNCAIAMARYGYTLRCGLSRIDVRWRLSTLEKEKSAEVVEASALYND